MKLDWKDIRIDSYRDTLGVTVKLVHLPTCLVTKIYRNVSEVKAREEALKELEIMVEKWMARDE